MELRKYFIVVLLIALAQDTYTIHMISVTWWTNCGGGQANLREFPPSILSQILSFCSVIIRFNLNL